VAVLLHVLCALAVPLAALAALPLRAAAAAAAALAPQVLLLLLLRKCCCCCCDDTERALASEDSVSCRAKAPRLPSCWCALGSTHELQLQLQRASGGRFAGGATTARSESAGSSAVEPR
jgi:hypothetical protein